MSPLPQFAENKTEGTLVPATADHTCVCAFSSWLRSKPNDPVGVGVRETITLPSLPFLSSVRVIHHVMRMSTSPLGGRVL